MENKVAIPINVRMQKIYVKELSYKVPRAPDIFISEEFKSHLNEPIFSVEFHTKHQSLVSNQHEITMHAIVSAKSKDNTTSYALDIQQSAIFVIEGIDEKQMPDFINNVCVSQLYPYLCKAVADASYQAGFPPITLAPLHAETAIS